jgi:4-amino-4-deoxy-L-arabinose transferase-like glycosyltransferase
MRNETGDAQARHCFLLLWAGTLALKLLLAAHLPLFVDEAFYWQEGRHLAAAYSDLPGLTAWLARLGVALGGNNALALRAPFLLLGALVPWLVASITRRAFAHDPAGERWGWHAGTLAVLVPLSGTLGLMALPDASLALATLLCVDAGARLLRKVDAAAALELAMGLALGALSHYRFIAVIGVGFVALLMLPAGRTVLRDVRVWIALALGAVAWVPLMVWNLDNADAGLRFQLIERHPWAFHVDGFWFIAIQALLATPLLFAAMGHAAWRGLRADGIARYFALLGAGVVLGFFGLGFFADVERVSFHWPLPGYLALLPLVPAALAQWPRGWRRAAWALAAAGLVAMCGYYAAVSVPQLRARFAADKWYPSNFAGWNVLADAVREHQARMPGDTRVVADNFKIGAELGFALDDPDIAVLPHALNRKHGRAPQLALWKLRAEQREELGARPLLLVVGASEVEYRNLLAHYHELCDRLGPLPAPQAVNIDHGRQRFLLFALPAQRAAGACTTPAMAWIDAPTPRARRGRAFEVQGWAFKDGVGIERVEVTLDGKVVAVADYGLSSPGTAAYWKISTDPHHPYVGFSAHVRVGGIAPGVHWLGLRLTGRDGSVEPWPEQPVRIVD